jgi:tetraacyldisaccharide 4'-kinase
MRSLLLPLSFLYGAGVLFRNWFFDIGILKTQSAGVPVISVGNLSAGGVGKTPFVELLVRRLRHKGRNVAVVSRGYMRSSTGLVVVNNGSVRCSEASESGDEPAQMASKLEGTVVIVDEQRVRGARYAVGKFQAEVIVLDDGFQHRYLRRDADVVIMSIGEVLSPGMLLPAGNRREPFSSLERASLIAISRCESVQQFESALQSLRRWTNKPVIGLATKISAVRKASTKFSVDLGGLRGKRVVAYSGIGAPASFEATLQTLGVHLAKHVMYPDHHAYGEVELGGLEDECRACGADFLITTEKDIARLDPKNPAHKEFLDRAPLYFVEIELGVLQGESILTQLLEQF